MSHLDLESLALYALGEDLSADDVAHLHDCAECTNEVDSLVRIVDVGRTVDDPELVEPPVHVWAAIESAISTDSSPDEARLDVAPSTVDASTPDRETPLALPARRRSPLTAALGLAAGVAIGAAGVLGWQELDSDDPEPPPIAAANLEPLAGTTPGQAQLTEEDGQRFLTVEFDQPNPDDGFYEVWLLSPDAGSLVSLGTLDGRTGTFNVPPGLELTGYPIVDVSIEPYDGDPAHSSNSVVRGELRNEPA